MPGNELSDFEAVEQCHLDYNVSRGSHIDMHFDDFWLWGDRLVTLNLLSHSIISLTHPQLPYTVRIPCSTFKVPGMTKNTSHTISIYGKMLVIHFPCNSIRTENCMKGL